MNASEKLTNPVKLLIWDLDETFWKGTLSEEGIEFIKPHCDLVIELSKRGIVNSICSKNDADRVQEMLKQNGLAEYFVFSRISWNPKGPAIMDMINSMGLRPPNVLFIDDNHMNLEEAKHYAPGIQVASPNILTNLADMDVCRGKPDFELSRLKQYRLLEHKHKEQSDSGLSNAEFLRESEISVFIGKDVQNHVDRLYELINRTNQLNFTKLRPGLEEVRDLIDDEMVECGYLSVSDKYGNYGITGFYALRGNKLEHFLFSCRILNMGVEQWLYNQLDRPELNVVEPVASSLEEILDVDWISQSSSHVDEEDKTTDQGALSILIKGGCDLQQLAPYLATGGEVLTEFNYVGSSPLQIRNEHTEMLRRTIDGRVQDFEEVISRIPFLDEKAYESIVFNANYDVLIYSINMDFTYGLYRYQDTDFVIPYADYLLNMTCEDDWPKLTKRQAYPEDFLPWFRDNFTALGPITPEQFTENIHWLSQLLPNKQIIFINGSEVNIDHKIEVDRWMHYRDMNTVLEKAVEKCANTQICDVRPIIQSVSDVKSNLRRFHRQGYYQIAISLQQIITKTTAQSVSVSKFNYFRNRTLFKLLRFPLRVAKVIGRALTT